MSDRRLQRRRNRLWADDPSCHWCGKETVLPMDLPGGGNDQTEPRMATIDHLDSRLDETRGAFPNHEITRTVLACRECNERRGSTRQAQLPIEELRRRASHD
jgi:hypothetical protein